jgi:UDP-N-acetylglucosamine 1-carboxyvinyltransferase
MKNSVASFLSIARSEHISGVVRPEGAKNAVLVTMASLLLTSGVSRLTRVPDSDDVWQMIAVLRELGAEVTFEHGLLHVDTRRVSHWRVDPAIMRRMRASILVLGPLLARFGRAEVAVPGGCVLGARPIDYHLRGFAKMGAHFSFEGDFLLATTDALRPASYILDYPSVGATENIMMAAALTPGITRIANAALEPEVFDLMAVLRAMGARIIVEPPATILIEGCATLSPIDHEVMGDRLEAGTLMIAAAATQGDITIVDAPVESLELVAEKLDEMGHSITCDPIKRIIRIIGAPSFKAVSFKTMPYPGFPTDLQAPMMALLARAEGVGSIHETVFENRMTHVRELIKMGAQITLEGSIATIRGVDQLYGASVIATDIRAAAGLVIAGLSAEGITHLSGLHHLTRGYVELDKKLLSLGARIFCDDSREFVEKESRAV